MAKDSATQREKSAKRRLKQLGKTIKPSVSGWSDSEDELAVGQEGNYASIQAKHVKMVTMSKMPGMKLWKRFIYSVEP